MRLSHDLSGDELVKLLSEFVMDDVQKNRLLTKWIRVATLGTMVVVGIKKLKNKLSAYVRLVKDGETVLVTDRGTVVAELAPPKEGRSQLMADKIFTELVERGWVTPPARPSDEPPLVRPVAKFSKIMAGLEEDLKIALEIAEALEEAHRHGIVHRDIKPSNIILAEQGHVLQSLDRGNPWWNSGAGQFTIANNGTMVYASGGILKRPSMELVWVGRNGKVDTQCVQK